MQVVSRDLGKTLFAVILRTFVGTGQMYYSSRRESDGGLGYRGSSSANKQDWL
jgi:hypothetical protein